MSMCVRVLGQDEAYGTYQVGSWDGGSWEVLESYPANAQGFNDATRLCNFLNGGTGLDQASLGFIVATAIEQIKKEMQNG